MGKNIGIEENFNIINYLKIVDLSLLNIFDYLDFSNVTEDLTTINDKLALTINPRTKKLLLEGFIINNVNNSIYYGKTNILVNSCEPYNNWRNSVEKINSKFGKCLISDDSLYVDDLKLNTFLNDLFQRLPNINAKLITKYFHKTFSSYVNISSKASLKYLNLKEVDMFDTFSILDDILTNFGSVTLDDFGYHIIYDGNMNFNHGSNLKYDSSIIDLIKVQLIEQGII